MKTFTIEDLEFSYCPNLRGPVTIASHNKSHKPAKSFYTIPGFTGVSINIGHSYDYYASQTMLCGGWSSFTITISQRNAEFILRAANGKGNYGDWMKHHDNRSQYWVLKKITNANNKFHPEYLNSSGCKEVACNLLNNETNSTLPEIFISEDFTEKGLEWLLEIQKNIEPANRFSIDKRKHFLRLKFPPWWFANTQGQYRIGWALLAARSANGRQPIAGTTMEKYFNKFIEGHFSLKTTVGWTGAANWHCFSKEPNSDTIFA